MPSKPALMDNSDALETVFPMFGNSAKAGSLILQPLQEQVVLSSGAGRLFGTGPDTRVLSLTDWLACFAPSSQPPLRDLLVHVQSGAALPDLELELLTADGRVRRLHLLLSPHPEQAQTAVALCFAPQPQTPAVPAATFWPHVIDALQIGLWDWNIRTNAVERTRQWSHLLGLDPDKPSVIADWESHIHPDDRAACTQTLMEHFNGHSTLSENEYRIAGPDGTYRWIADRGKIIERDENGEPTRMCGFIMDVTLQKKLQEKHDAREIQFRAVFNSLFHFIGLLNTDGTVLECNRTVYEFSGLPLDHMKGAPIWEGYWWVGDTIRTALQAWVKQAAAGEVVQQEVELRNHQGMQVVMDFAIRPVFDNAGRVMWLVTEGRNVREVQAPPPPAPLPDTARPWLPESSEALAILDLSGFFVSANHSFCHLVGYSENELKQRTFMDITHPEDTELDVGYMQGLLDGKCDRYMLEKRYLHQDGTPIPILLDGSVTRSRSGEPLHVIAKVTDLRPAWHETTMRRNGA